MNKKKRIAFQTLGCKLNFSETSAISRQFSNGMYEQVPYDEPADIYVINSCTVTKKADKRCRALIRQAKSTNPACRIIVMGCYPQAGASDLMSLPGVSHLLDNTQKFRLLDYIEGMEKAVVDKTNMAEPGTGIPRFVPAYSLGGRTRSFFKIQDGCDYNCSYCSIPLARGHSRSDTIAATVKTARKIAETDIKEVVLTGVNIGDFGKPHGESFFDLLKELIKIDGLLRIRLSSVEPDLLHDDIIRLVAAEPKLMPHFHIPLQSGSDAILRSMGRRYDTALFTSRVQAIRKHIPHACIAADLIVGYPEETDELFKESLRFISKTDVSYMHVFNYSEREHTRAIKSQHRVDPSERRRRSKMMQQLSAEKKNLFTEANRGLKTTVLWEKERQGHLLFGFTENYIKIKTSFDTRKVNAIQAVQLISTDKNGVYTV